MEKRARFIVGSNLATIHASHWRAVRVNQGAGSSGSTGEGGPGGCVGWGDRGAGFWRWIAALGPGASVGIEPLDQVAGFAACASTASKTTKVTSSSRLSKVPTWAWTAFWTASHM